MSVVTEARTPVHQQAGSDKQTTGKLRGHPWWTLASVALGVIMVGLDGSVVAIANPKIAIDLHASLSDLQWITNAYLLALAAFLIVGGKLGDKFGRRRIFLIGVVGFAVTSVGIGLVDTTGGVIGLRVLQGLFGAMLMPNTLAILRSTFPKDKLNMAIGIWGGASAVSIAAGPIIGGLLVEHVSWQSVFFINAPIGAIALLIGAMVLKESRNESDAHGVDYAGIGALTGSLFLVVFGLIKAQTWGWVSGKTLGFILGGLALMAVFVVIERRVKHPLLPMRLFRNRSLSIGTTVLTINFFAMFGVLFFITLFLENVQSLTPVGAGLRTLPLSLTLVAFAPLGGFMTEKFGPRVPMVAGLVAVAGGLLLLTGLNPHSGFSALWPAFVLLGAGLGLVITSGSDAIVGNASVDDAGVAGGLQNTATQLGGVMGTAVLGSVLASRIGSVLVDKLTSAGTPAAITRKLTASKELVGQGLAPTTGYHGAVRAAITEGSHNAFMTGLHTSMVIAAVVTLLAAVLAMFVQRGENSGSAAIGH